LKISDDALRRGLKQAVWHGRFEIISGDPLMIFDGAHNPQGIASAVESIRCYFGDQKVYVLTGVLKDKDYTAIASDLSTVADKAFVMTPDNPRALAAADYAQTLRSFDVDATPYESLREALCAAREAAKEKGVPLVCLGSLYVYSTLIPLLEEVTSHE
jgi:dihydrofolate synthase/folylpolyglutamate synthase